MQSYNPFFRGKVGLVLLAGLILGQAVQAQCVGNLATRTYDTALTSNGFGVFDLRFPQFSPDSGTLVSVRLVAKVNSMYGFTLRNADTLATTYSLTVGEQDEFNSPSLPAPYVNVTSQSIGDYPLNPGQSVTQAPVSFLNNHISSDSVTAVSSFLGTGPVNLRYQAFTFTNLSAVNNAAYYYSAGISNTLEFSLQYLYCRSAVLATDLSGWSATPVGPRNVQLDWTAANETTGREYIVQRGSDAHNFTNIATLPATADGSTASYTYPDELPAAADSSWYYRLQILDAGGQISYSGIKEVSLAAAGKGGLQFYPNPATDFINLVPDRAEPTDWQVDIFSANGNLIQRNVFMQTHTMLVNFNGKLSAGAYFVRALDLRGQRSCSASFMVPGGH